jgi:hypothetical protein
MVGERDLPTRIRCLECGRDKTIYGQPLRYLSGTHLAMHRMTKADYLHKYPEAETYTADYSRNHAEASAHGNPDGHMEKMTENTVAFWQEMYEVFAQEGYLTPEKAAQKLNISGQAITRAVVRKSLSPDFIGFVVQKGFLRTFYMFTEETIETYKNRKGARKSKVN